MRYIQELTLDVLQATKNKYIYAKQVDNDSRFLRITMMSGSTKIIPEENDSAIFRCEKPDKKSVLNPAAINQDGTVTVELTRQVLACTGTVKADVSIVNDNTVLSTVTFYIKVEKMPVTADQTVSSNEFLYLVEKVQEAEQFLKRGGTTGQVLKKKSNDDFDTEWGDDEGGGGSAIDVGAVPQVTGEFLYNNGSKIEDPKWHNKTVQCTTDYQEYQAWYFYKIRNDGDGAVRTDVQPQPDIPQIEHIQKSGADLDEIIDVIDGNIYQCTSNYSTDKSSISNDTQFHQGYFYLYNGEQAQYTYTRKDTQPTSGGAVDSVNGKTGDVVLDASDVGALPDNTPLPSKTSDLQNDSNFLSSSQVDVNSVKPYDYEQTYTIPQDITSGSTVQIEFANTLREFALEITTPEAVISAMTGYFYLTLDNGNSGGRFWEPAFGQNHASKLCVAFTKGRDGIYRLNGYKYGLTSDTDWSAGITYNSFARQNVGRLYLNNPQPIAGIQFNVASTFDISELAGTTIKVRGLKW